MQESHALKAFAAASLQHPSLLSLHHFLVCPSGMRCFPLFLRWYMRRMMQGKEEARSAAWEAGFGENDCSSRKLWKSTPHLFCWSLEGDSCLESKEHPGKELKTCESHKDCHPSSNQEEMRTVKTGFFSFHQKIKSRKILEKKDQESAGEKGKKNLPTRQRLLDTTGSLVSTSSSSSSSGLLWDDFPPCDDISCMSHKRKLGRHESLS